MFNIKLGHRTRFFDFWKSGGDTVTVPGYISTPGGGDPHQIGLKFPYLKLGGGWVVGGWGSLHNPASLRLHLASWNLKDCQSSWESKMEPSVAIITFPVFKINFVFVGKYGEDVVKLVFWSEAWKLEKQFHFLFWKLILNLLDQMRNIQ